MSLLAALLMVNWQCRPLRTWQPLRPVDFYMDRVSAVSLAGVALDHVRRYEDLPRKQARHWPGVRCCCDSDCLWSPTTRSALLERMEGPIGCRRAPRRKFPGTSSWIC